MLCVISAKMACNSNVNLVKTGKWVRDRLRKLFEAAQEHSGNQNLVDKCKKLYTKCENEEIFLSEFITILRYCFVYTEKLEVERMLSFASKFAVSLYNIEKAMNDSDDIECSTDMHPFVSGILDFLFNSHGASSVDARIRCVQLLNKILSALPENSSISDEVWTKLSDAVLSRIQDKNPNVRVQAVLTARKLQDPKNSKCHIIEALAFHLNDPSSSVRRTVVSSIALNKITIGYVLARTRDVNDNVRRNAYIVFSKVRVLNLTIKYRVTILERGLQDRSDMVRNSVENLVVVHWLENFNKDVLKFLEALDVVSCPDVAILTLKSIFKTQPMEDILKCLPLDDVSHTVPVEDLTPEVALLWRCLAHHFREQEKEEELELILPNLVIFCEYVQRFYPIERIQHNDLSDDEQWAEVKDKQTLMHLLELAKVFDLSDEMGRSNLKKLIVSFLTSSLVSNDVVQCLIQLMVPVIPNTETFLQELTEVISEVREPLNHIVSELPQKKRMELDLQISDLKVNLNDLREKEYDAVQNKDYAEAQKLKDQIEEITNQLDTLSSQTATTQEIREEKNDPVTLCKCLSILVQMIKCSGVRTLTTTLRTLQENFLDQCLKSQDLMTQSLAIQALAQFCIIDKDLAKENLFRFVLMLSENGDNEVNIPALKAIFDIIHRYGIESFEKLDESTEKSNENLKSTNLILEDEILVDSASEEKLDQSTSGAKCISLLKELINCKSNEGLKTVAYEGLCKLLLSGVVYSPSLLARVIIKGFSPIVDSESEDFIRQVFMVFFPMFASSTPRSQEMIEATFIPTMRVVMYAPYGTPDADINPKDVASFLIEYTKPEINNYTSKTLHVHNNLALSICHEILRDHSTYNELGVLHIYLKSLLQLTITHDSESFLHQLQTLSIKIEEELTEKAQIRLLKDFQKKIEEKLQCTFHSVDNTLVTTTNETQTTKDRASDCDSLTSAHAKISVLSTVSDVQSEAPCVALPEVNQLSLEETIISESDESLSNKVDTEGGCVPETPEVSTLDASSPEIEVEVEVKQKKRKTATLLTPTPRVTRQSTRKTRRSLRKL